MVRKVMLMALVAVGLVSGVEAGYGIENIKVGKAVCYALNYYWDEKPEVVVIEQPDGILPIYVRYTPSIEEWRVFRAFVERLIETAGVKTVTFSQSARNPLNPPRDLEEFLTRFAIGGDLNWYSSEKYKELYPNGHNL